ncbi:MAG: NAD-dependent DNA ligase LigA, partial [Firmicutes bacterium]|nr:NAD-dependent DNA ligase LigA [Bacillota bacterium]
MDLLSMQARIDALTTELLEHNRRYYEGDAPSISDYEYDQKLAELRRLEEEAPLFARPDSPTKNVGGSAPRQFAPVTHRVPVISLDNSYDRNDLLEFHRRTIGGVADPGQVSYV